MLAKRLRKVRIEKGFTQEEIADYLGFSRPTYTAYESGRRKPDNDTLVKIAKLLNVSTDYLLGLSDIKTPMKEKKLTTDPRLDDLLLKVPNLTEEEKESLAEHMEFALKQIEKERQRRAKNKNE